MTKSFVVVAAIFILVGGSIGGAFTGGVILGRNQAESEAPAAANFVPPEGFSSDQAAALRQMAGQLSQAGGASQSVSATSVRNTGATGNRTSQSVASDASQEAPVSADNAGATAGGDGQTGFAGFGRGLGVFGGGATFGTIDSIGEGVVVINTPQGPVEAAISSETVIQVFIDGEVGDLEEGMSVTVMGQEDAESGKLEAASIIASPEGAGGFPGFGGFQNRPQGGGNPFRRPSSSVPLGSGNILPLEAPEGRGP